MGNLFVIGYYLLVAIVVIMLGYRFHKSKDGNFKRTMELILPVFVALVPVMLTVVSPEKAVEVAFPDLEKYIKRTEELEKEKKELSKVIVDLEQNQSKIQEKNKQLSEKKYAEITDAGLVIDGLEIKTVSNLLAVVDGKNYYHEDVLKEVTDKKSQYDDEQKKVFIGNQEVNKVNKIRFSEVSHLLYGGENYVKYDEKQTKPFLVAGKEYESGMVIESSKYATEGSYVLFNLDGKYSKIEFNVGKIDDTYSIEDAKMKIHLDGEVSKQEKVAADIPYTPYEIEVGKAKSLKLALHDSSSSFGFYDIVLTE